MATPDRTPPEPCYVLTEAQRRTLARLTDAARLLAAALPPAYTTTPIGPLASLADEASAILLFLNPEQEVPS